MTTQRKIRVLHLTYNLTTGGAERVAVNYAKFLDRDRFEVWVGALTSVNHFEKELEDNGIPYVLLKKRRGVDLRLPFRLMRLLRSQRFDIVHFHDASCSLWGTIPASLTGVKAIIRTLHNVTDGERVMSRIQSMGTRLMYRYHTRFLAVSSEVRESQSKKYPSIAGRITTLHNGIDPTLFDFGVEREPYLKEFGATDRTVIIGVVARLAPQKAHEVFLEAMKLVVERRDDVTALIVGDGPEREALEAMSVRMGLENHVIFTGVRGDVPQLLSILDIFALSSDWEGFPMTILEAMASGSPVVVTDVGGNREAVLEGQTGLLVAPRDPQALAAALLKLAANRDLRLDMGSKGRERFLNHFTADAMARATEAIYLEYCRPGS